MDYAPCDMILRYKPARLVLRAIERRIIGLDIVQLAPTTSSQMTLLA